MVKTAICHVPNNNKKANEGGHYEAFVYKDSKTWLNISDSIANKKSRFVYNLKNVCILLLEKKIDLSSVTNFETLKL